MIIFLHLCSMFIFTAAIIFFFVLEIIYFKIANHFNIIDKPNLRSSHSQITLRGGGIIFPIAFICGISIWQPSLWVIGLAVLLISTISFLDDLLTLNNKLRIFIHVMSVLLLLYQIYLNQTNAASLFLNPYSLILIPLSLILIIGIINAYNFMDGINGITVLYSMVTVASLWFIQNHVGILLFEKPIWILILAALLVFCFFNLRKKAKAFAGDIGSISMAFILCFLIFTLIFRTNDLKWLLLLGIYGLDAVGTITCRMIRKENIFEAHRSHFYQFLANEKKWPHVLVAIIFSVFQLLLNVALIATNQVLLTIFIYLIIILIYITARLNLEGKKRLFENYTVV
jgi:UDP-GlcNAc:undecaprenyl-phosphate GlcNAc-1-phosphate transferase